MPRGDLSLGFPFTPASDLSFYHIPHSRSSGYEVRISPSDMSAKQVDTFQVTSSGCIMYILCEVVARRCYRL